MKIAVVILNWNGKELLQKFLPSVVLHSSEATIYVADNASSDDSIAFVKSIISQFFLLYYFVFQTSTYIILLIQFQLGLIDLQ